MLEEQSKAIRRVDYTAPAFWIDTVDLTFDLDLMSLHKLCAWMARN
jgi:hypothetical protein